MRPQSTTKPLADRFWAKVEKTATCWLWTGAKYGGYGRLNPGKHSGVPLRAHRVSWELHYGPIPQGMVVCHRCDNPSCVRPDHLFLGSHEDNMLDAVRKGRTKKGRPAPESGQPGELHHHAKLTNADVRAIRARRAAGEPIATLARDYGIHQTHVRSIVRRDCWKHID